MYRHGLSVSKATAALLVAISSFTFCSIPTPLLAQFSFNDQSESETLIKPPRDVTRLLSEAKSEIASSHWSEATKALGLIMGLEPESAEMEGEGQDFFVAESSGEFKKTIHQQALELFDSMPKVGQDTVEIRYGIDAQKELEKAIETSDWKKIDSLAGKYLMTVSGRQAALLAAEHQIAIGHPAWASSRFDALLKLKSARDQFGPHLGLVSASAWKAAGNAPMSKKVLSKTSTLFSVQSVDFLGKRIDLTNVETAYDALSTDLIVHRTNKQSAPRMQGGNPNRNGDTFAGLPLPFVSWQSLLHESSRHEDRARDAIDYQLKQVPETLLVPSRSAVIVAPHLVVMTYDLRIHGIHLQTGALEWVSAFAGIPRSNRQSVPEYREPKNILNDELTHRIWGQKAIGQLSADENQIYTIVEEASLDTAENLQRGVNATITMQPPLRDYNVLQAYSIAKQAALAWEVGGDNGLADPQMANVLFLGPPLPVNNELFVIGELNGEILLFSLDPAKGTLNWKQQLAANNSISVANDSTRRDFGSSPSLHGGTLICPSLSNQLVAVDIVSHSLLWAVQYQPKEPNRGQANMGFFGGRQPQPPKSLEFRSSDTSVIVDNGVAVYAPPDSAEVFAVDIFTGNKLWMLPDGKIQYVGCIVEDCVVASKGKTVVGLDLRTGKTRWTSELSDNGTVVGQMVRNGNHVLVPLVDRKILELNASDGKVVGNTRVESQVGNLIATQDSLISVSPVSVTCYPIRDQVKKRLAEDLAGQEESPIVFARRAEIALSDSDISTAFELGSQAYKRAPADPDIRALLRKVALEALNSNFELFSPRVREISDLLESGPQRDSYSQLLIRGLLARQQYDEALDRLVSLALLKGNDLHAEDLGQRTELEIAKYQRVFENCWIASTFDRLFRECSAEARDKAVARIIERLTQNPTLRANSSLLERYTRYIPQTSVFRLHRAINDYASQNFLLAESFAVQAYELSSQLPRNSDAEKIQRYSELLRLMIYRDAGRMYSAVQLANRLNVPLAEVRTLSVQKLLEDELFRGLQPINFSSVKLPAILAESSRLPGLTNDTEEFQANVLEDFVEPRSTEIQNHQVDITQREINNPESMFGELKYTQKAVFGDGLEGWAVKSTGAGIKIFDPTYQSSIDIQLSAHPVNEAGQRSSGAMLNSLVLLQRGNVVSAIDTFATSIPNDKVVYGNRSRARDATRWVREFGSISNSVQNPIFNSGRQSGNRTADLWEFGAEKVRHDGNVSTQLTDHFGFVVATSSEITCIDGLYGETLWKLDSQIFQNALTSTRDNNTSPPWLSYKDGKLYAIDPISKQRLIVDARDGSVIDSQQLKFVGSIWNVYEDKFLTFNSYSGGKRGFHIYSLIEGREPLYTCNADASDKATLANDMFACWGEKGLSVYNLQTEKDYHYEIGSAGRISQIRLHRFNDTYLLIGFTSSNKKAYLEKTELEFQEALGRLLAINAITGEPLWHKPIESFYALPLHQPRNSPAIVLTRHLNHRVNKNRLNTASVALIELKTARLLYENNYLPSTNGSEFVAKYCPPERKLTFSYRGNGIEAVWTDKEMALSEPIESIGDTNGDELLQKMPDDIRTKMNGATDDSLKFNDEEGLFE